MANTLTQNPLIFDTAGASSAYLKKGKITAIHWNAISGVGQDVSLRETETGRIVWQMEGRSDNSRVPFPEPFYPRTPIPFESLYVDVLDSGTLFVYLE